MSAENSGPPKARQRTLRWLAFTLLALAAGAALAFGLHRARVHRIAKARKISEAKARLHASQKRKKPVIAKTPALTAEQELASFTLDPRFRIELMAGDALVKNPVALAFDPGGRVWVCEMQGYMPNVEGKGEGEPLGRIVILEDTDGDGRLDKSTVFLDGLVLPRTLALVGDGVLVGAPPSLWFCRDRDGDGRCDEKIEVDPKYAVGGEASPEHMPNGLLWAMDNWIYSANSTARYRRKVDGPFERAPTSFRGQWGLAQDDWGRLFYNYHISHLHADIVASSHYQDRNRHAPAEIGLNPIVSSDQRVWPSHPTPGINSGPSALAKGKLKEFTSACGPTIYRGELFPSEFQGNAFVCEPVGNLIKRDIVRDRDGVPKAEPAEAGSEFLTSTDERFRPVNLYTGPDGALWVVDMYQGIVEHKTYMTGYLKKQIVTRGLDKPAGLGRLWRIVPKDAPAARLSKMPQATTDELLAALQHTNGWRRDTAQRLLVERRDLAVAPALRQLLEHAPTAAVRLHAIWTLDGLGLVDLPTVELALANSEPKVRAAGLRLSEAWLEGDPALAKRVLGMARDEAPEVRLQLMLTLGELPTPEAMKVMVTLLAQAEGNTSMQVAAWTGVGGRELKFLQAYLGSSSGAQPSQSCTRMLRGLTQALLSERDSGRCLGLLDFVAQQPAPWPRAEVMDAIGVVPLTAGAEFRPITLEREPQQWAALAGGEDRERAAKVAELFSWPGKPSPRQAPVAPLTPAQQQLFVQGETLFGQLCAACHQPTGLGQEGLAPPLVNSEWTLGNEQRLTRILLNGLAGQIMVAGRTYYMDMPPLGALSDEQIASVLTYIRRAWGHTATPVEVETVSEIRAAVGPRDKPWNARSLGKFR